MSLLSIAKRYVPFFGKAQPSRPRQEIMLLRPVRNQIVEWDALQSKADDEDDEETNAGIVLVVPGRDERIGPIWSRIFQIPNYRKIQLDEIGSGIWSLCDGDHTINQLIAHTSETYKLNRRQAEVSVTQYMKMLSQRRLIAFIEEKGESHVGSKSRPNKQRRRSKASKRN